MFEIERIDGKTRIRFPESLLIDQIEKAYQELGLIVKEQNPIILDLFLLEEADTACIQLILWMAKTQKAVIENLNKTVENIFILYGIDFLPALA